METKLHTPDPWVSRTWNEGSRGNITAVNEPFQPTVAVLVCDNPHAIANGHLISAAPDLLDALQQLVKWMDESGLAGTPDGGIGPFKYTGTEYSVVTDARAAIEKAEGK